MRVFIMGGTGLLGYHATLALLDNGHQITNLSSGSFQPGDWYPSDVDLTYGDVFSLSSTDLEKRLHGYDALVYALGPDDRVAPPAPAYDFFFERLVLTAEKACKAARAAGVRRVVVLNSYLAYFHRKNPAWQLAERHPYIRCRVEQAACCLGLATDEFTVMVFEIPYVFGTMPERTSLWEKVLMPRIR